MDLKILEYNWIFSYYDQIKTINDYQIKNFFMCFEHSINENRAELRRAQQDGF